MASRPGWRRVRLALNVANLAASLALIAGALWASLGERGWRAPTVLLRSYRPVLAALHWYGSTPIAPRGLLALCSLLSLVLFLFLFLLSFKIHLEEIVVVLLGIPFYLLVACSFFLVAGLVAGLFRLLL